MVTDSSTSANRATTREKPSFQVVYFGNVNEYQATSMEERLSVYQEVKNLCKTGHIVVNGKALKLSEGGFQGEIRDNEVFCTLDFEYFEERPGIADSNPVATDIQINQKEV